MQTIECPICQATFFLKLVLETASKEEVRHIYGQHHISKLKLPISIFDAMSGEKRQIVSRAALMEELIHTKKFSIEEAQVYIEESIANGCLSDQIPGVLYRV